jgi:hypothetical protein
VEENWTDGVDGRDLFEAEVRKKVGFFVELYWVKAGYFSKELPVLLDAFGERRFVRGEELAHRLLRLGFVELQAGLRFPLEEVNGRAALGCARLGRSPLDHITFVRVN